MRAKEHAIRKNPCRKCGEHLVIRKTGACAICGAVARARNYVPRGIGRPAIMRPCGICGQSFGVAAMRKHVTGCKPVEVRA